MNERKRKLKRGRKIACTGIRKLRQKEVSRENKRFFFCSERKLSKKISFMTTNCSP